MSIELQEQSPTVHVRPALRSPVGSPFGSPFGSRPAFVGQRRPLACKICAARFAESARGRDLGVLSIISSRWPHSYRLAAVTVAVDGFPMGSSPHSWAVTSRPHEAETPSHPARQRWIMRPSTRLAVRARAQGSRLHFRLIHVRTMAFFIGAGQSRRRLVARTRHPHSSAATLNAPLE